jgi:hypothetical protein
MHFPEFANSKVLICVPLITNSGSLTQAGYLVCFGFSRILGTAPQKKFPTRSKIAKESMYDLITELLWTPWKWYEMSILRKKVNEIGHVWSWLSPNLLKR